MKRLFILATAAIVALASCAKTEVVYTDAPEEIGFKAVTGAMTKGTLEAKGYTTMGVIAYNEAMTEVYFPNTQFSNGGSGNNWTGGQYWPSEASTYLNFIYYAPYASDAEFVTNTLTLTIPDNTTAQTDWLYGTEIHKTNKTTAGTTGVVVDLKHALAKVSVVLTTSDADAFKFVSLKLNETDQAGELAIAYPSLNVTPTPADPAVKYTHAFTALAADAPIPASTDMGSILVLPGDDTSFTFVYKIGDSSIENTETITLNSTWAASTHYIYTINLAGDQITMVPTVLDWTKDPLTPAFD